MPGTDLGSLNVEIYLFSQNFTKVDTHTPSCRRKQHSGHCLAEGPAAGRRGAGVPGGHPAS